MATKKQINANRNNAKKSTGPKTEEGKAKSAQNATKHGLTATTDVIKGESREDYDAHKQGFLDVLNPQNAIEDFLADRVVSLAWRLKRAARMQNRFQDAYIADHEYHQEYRHGDYYMPSNKNPDLILGCFAKKDYHCDKVLERLALYERRMERSFFKCFNELKRRKRKAPPSRVGLAPPSESDNLCPRGGGAKKQTQSSETKNTATSGDSELYNLCAHAGATRNKANGDPPGTVKDAPRVAYRSTTRRY